MKEKTITKLELRAATVIAQVDQKLSEELDLHIKRSIFWTDSSAVLKYLNNERVRFHTFVSNLINLIRELTNITDWNY